MKRDAVRKYSLSYPITTVNWNGERVTRMPDETFLPVCRILKELGVDRLMITGYVTVEEADFDMMAETARLGALLDSMGMRPAQHHGLSATYAPRGKDQSPVVERLIRAVRYTANLNSPVLVIHPGHYYDPESWGRVSNTEMFERESAALGREEVIGTMAENLHAAGEEARKLGVKIALENVDRFEAAGNAAILPELVRRTDSPAVGFCLDSGHAHCCGEKSVTEWISLMEGRLFTTHFHDNRGPRAQAATPAKWISPSGIDEHLPPGFGTIPWIDVIQSLWSAGFSGPVNFESGAWPGMEPEEGFSAAIRFWRCCETLAEKKLS